jgi:hypothetical protein
MNGARQEDEAVAHCPVCWAEYRSGFDVCSDCGVPLVAGPVGAADGEAGASDASGRMTDAQYTSALADLRAHPDAFVALATLPWVEAHEVAGDLWKAGIQAVFVPRDDPAAPPDPIATFDDMEEDDEVDGTDDEDDDEEADRDGGEAVGESLWEQDPTTWRWHASAVPESADADEDDEDADDEEEDEPPPGLERVRGGSVQPWLRPNQPPVASAVLCVRSEDEDQARRVAGRRLGVL